MADYDALSIIASVQTVMSVADDATELEPEADVFALFLNLQQLRAVLAQLPSEPELQRAKRAKWLLGRILVCYGCDPFHPDGIGSGNVLTKGLRGVSASSLRDLARCFRMFNGRFLTMLDVLQHNGSIDLIEAVIYVVSVQISRMQNQATRPDFSREQQALRLKSYSYIAAEVTEHLFLAQKTVSAGTGLAMQDVLLSFKKYGTSYVVLDKELEKFVSEVLPENATHERPQIVTLDTVLNASRPYKRHLYSLSRSLSKVTRSSTVTSGDASRARSRSLLFEQLSL